jgi:hypothetical protein
VIEAITLENSPSRRLPPLEAWKQPDKWVDVQTGLPKPFISKLVLETDDRGFIDPDRVVEHIEDVFFWKDYDWPFESDDLETAPDDHHFYHTSYEYSPRMNNGSKVPKQFRELPTVIGRMPRQFHNVIHDFTRKPDIPDVDAKQEYVKSYLLAHAAFKNLIMTAKNTTKASQMFSQRQQAIMSGAVVPADLGDIVAKEMMKDFFSKHFNAYSRSIDRFLITPESSLVVPDIQLNKTEKPHLLLRKMGKYALRSSINYTSTLRAV